MVFSLKKFVLKEVKIVFYFLIGGMGFCYLCMGCSEDGDFSYF